MLNPHPGLGLQAQKTGLGLLINGLGLVTVVASASYSLATWPQSF